MSDFVVGELVRVSAEFTNSAGSPADPDVIKFDYRDSEGEFTALVYNINPSFIRDSAGNYHVDIAVDKAGTWKWYFYSSGNGKAAAKGCFTVGDQWGECE